MTPRCLTQHSCPDGSLDRIAHARAKHGSVAGQMLAEANAALFQAGRSAYMAHTTADLSLRPSCHVAPGPVPAPPPLQMPDEEEEEEKEKKPDKEDPDEDKPKPDEPAPSEE